MSNTQHRSPWGIDDPVSPTTSTHQGQSLSGVIDTKDFAMKRSNRKTKSNDESREYPRANGSTLVNHNFPSSSVFLLSRSRQIVTARRARWLSRIPSTMDLRRLLRKSSLRDARLSRLLLELLLTWARSLWFDNNGCQCLYYNKYYVVSWYGFDDWMLIFDHFILNNFVETFFIYSQCFL